MIVSSVGLVFWFEPLHYSWKDIARSIVGGPSCAF
jgi:hypothetical protein